MANETLTLFSSMREEKPAYRVLLLIRLVYRSRDGDNCRFDGSTIVWWNDDLGSCSWTKLAGDWYRHHGSNAGCSPVHLICPGVMHVTGVA